MQGASHYAKMCLKIEELLPATVLALLNVVGRGYGERSVEASAHHGFVGCMNRNIGTAHILK